MNSADALTGAKVLLVDDAPANLDLLRGIPEPSGCRIYFATSGEMTPEVAAGSNPYIILLDVMVPGIDGFETYSDLKNMPQLAETPVALVTARTGIADLARGFSVGGIDYITKPVRALEINTRRIAQSKLRRLLDQGTW